MTKIKQGVENERDWFVRYEFEQDRHQKQVNALEEERNNPTAS